MKAVWGVVFTWFDENVIQPLSTFFTNLWGTISTLASQAWEAIKAFFAPAVEWFSLLWGSVSQTFSDIFYNIGVIASGCWEVITAVWGVASSWVNENVIAPVSEFFSGMWESLKAGAAEAWEGIKSAFSTVAKFFGDIFRSAWEKVVEVFSPLGEIFIDIRDGILTVFKSIVNGIISGLNQAIAIPFSGINSALMGIKGFSIMGIQPFAGLRTIDVPQIPYLAQGAVIPPNREFMAVLGDQTHGRNLEAPEDLIRQIIREEIGNMGLGDISINFTGELAALARILTPVITREQRRASIAGGR